MKHCATGTTGEKKMLDRKFERFRGGPANRYNANLKPRVSISPKAVFYFNTKTFQEMGSPEAVALYYNREDDSIAIQPVPQLSAETFPIVKKNTGYGVHASSFFRHYRIRIKETQQFLNPRIDKDKNLIVRLRETIFIGGIDRPKKTSPEVEFAENEMKGTNSRTAKLYHF